MPKRRAAWQGTRSGARRGTQFYGTKFGGGTGMRFPFRRRQSRGRFAGYYRKAGYYPGANRGPELKFFDILVSDAVIAAGGTIQTPTNPAGAFASIVGIPSGTGESERIGRKCQVRSINWRYRLSLSETIAGTPPEETVRVILYLDKQTNGAAASVTDILELNDYQSFNNLSNKSRFRVLMDRTHNLNSTAGGPVTASTGDWAGQRLNFSFFKKCSIPLEFSSTTGNLTEMRSNNLNVLLLSDTGGLTTFTSRMRMRFSDD